jgi:hypothetical protein
VTRAKFTTPFLSVTNPPPALAIPFAPAFLPLTATDNAGATASIGVGLLPPAVGVGAVLQAGSFLQETGPHTATLAFDFILTYTAGAGGAAGQATAALDLAGQLFAATSFAVIDVSLNFAVGQTPFASQVLAFDTRAAGISGPGSFSRQVSAPLVFYNVPAGAALTITGAVTYTVGQALLVAPPALSATSVPAPPGLCLLASAAPLLIGFARRAGRNTAADPRPLPYGPSRPSFDAGTVREVG